MVRRSLGVVQGFYRLKYMKIFPKFFLAIYPLPPCRKTRLKVQVGPRTVCVQLFPMKPIFVHYIHKFCDVVLELVRANRKGRAQGGQLRRLISFEKWSKTDPRSTTVANKVKLPENTSKNPMAPPSPPRRGRRKTKTSMFSMYFFRVFSDRRS